MNSVGQEPAIAEQQANVSGLLDQAYEEFCARRDRGEAIAADQFCAEHPALQSRLGKLLSAHLFLEDHLELLNDPADIRWPEVGETYLGFDLIRELGRGAFARVFLAKQPKLGNRLVALKVAWRGGSGEAKILGKLLHPNIVPVHSEHADPERGLTAVCMPYLGSATLQDVLKNIKAPATRAKSILGALGKPVYPLDPSAHPTPVAPTLRNGAFADGVRELGARLADALAFLHEQDAPIYHQDLKPSNVLLTPACVPMLLDFNLSADAKAEAVVGGTLPYMAPEQLQVNDDAPAKADAQSDIYALGVMLYELAGGAHPFGPIPTNIPTGELRAMLLERQKAGAPDVCRHNPSIDRPLGELIRRCLAPNPQDRPASAAQLAAELRRELRPSARIRRFIGRHPWATLAAAMLVVAAVLAVAVPLVTRPPYPEREFQAGVRLYQQGQYKDAVARFNESLQSDPTNAEAYFARGLAFQELGALDRHYLQPALTDLIEADRMKPSIRNITAIAYCKDLNQMMPQAIIWDYKEVIKRGGESAEVRNNMGYNQMKINVLDEAQANLDRAIQLNDGLQAPYLNRATLHLQRALSLDQKTPNGPEVMAEVAAGIIDMDKAIKIGPASGELYFRAAHLHAVAMRKDPSQKEITLKYMQHAIEGKIKPSQIVIDPLLSGLKNDERYKKLVTAPEPNEPPSRATRIINPVKRL